MSNEEKVVEEVAKEELENLEEYSNDIKEEVIEDFETEQENLQTTAKNTHKELVHKAKITQDVAKHKYDEYLKADSALEDKSQNFIKQENEIIDGTVSTSLSLLKALGVDSLEDVNTAIAEIQKDNKEELMRIKKPSKGMAKGLVAGILGACATAAGAAVYGAKMASLPINSATFMQKLNLNSIATKYSELINIKGTPIAGYALVGSISLLVGFILYKLVTSMQKRRNIRYINRVEEDLENYKENLDTKINKIGLLSSHIDNIQSVMQKYDIILQEQNAKIRRMLFIEQPEEGIDSLQRASKLEVEKTVLILDELLELMNTPVNEGVDITNESDQRLHNANSVINEVIKKLYIYK